MSKVLNRDTLELRTSVNTPDFPDPPWLHNPDMSPVAGVSQRYWELTGNVLSEMVQTEKDATDAALAAEARDAERAGAGDAIRLSNAPADILLRALALTVLDEINALRERALMAPRTVDQLKTAIRNKISGGQGDV